MAKLSADDLLAGAQLRHRVVIPPELLEQSRQSEGDSAVAEGNAPGDDGTSGAAPAGDDVKEVALRPLQLIDLQRIQKASRDAEHLVSVLMLQHSLVEPQLTVEQVNRLPAGLAQFLLREVNRVSGLSISADELEQTVQAPMARACFVLAREFGWTPEQCAELSLGQVLLYLEMLGRQREEGLR